LAPPGTSSGNAATLTGADAVARWLSGRARAARLALVDGEPGAVWAADGTVRVAFGFTIADAAAGVPGAPARTARIVRIDLIAEPGVLAGLDIEIGLDVSSGALFTRNGVPALPPGPGTVQHGTR
jgi:hypothetical protein